MWAFIFSRVSLQRVVSVSALAFVLVLGLLLVLHGLRSGDAGVLDGCGHADFGEYGLDCGAGAVFVGGMGGLGKVAVGVWGLVVGCAGALVVMLASVCGSCWSALLQLDVCVGSPASLPMLLVVLLAGVLIGVVQCVWFGFLLVLFMLVGSSSLLAVAGSLRSKLAGSLGALGVRLAALADGHHGLALLASSLGAQVAVLLAFLVAFTCRLVLVYAQGSLVAGGAPGVSRGLPGAVGAPSGLGFCLSLAF